MEGSETAADIIRKKFKDLKISQETKELVRRLSLSDEEMNDEKTKHILGYRGCRKFFLTQTYWLILWTTGTINKQNFCCKSTINLTPFLPKEFRYRLHF